MRNARISRRRGVRVGLGAALLTLLLALFAVGCGGGDDTTGSGGGGETTGASSGGGGGGGSIDLVAYSTPQEAYEKELEPAFNGTPEGEGVSFSNSFAASGDSRRAVEAGQPADYVNLSGEFDMTPLVEAGLVASDWNANKYKGMVTNSVVAIVTRPGNPENVKSFQDIVDRDLDLVTANPAVSGGARWNILAVWGAITTTGGSEEAAREFTKQILSQATVQPTSARDALQAFIAGEGDVLLSYENEAIAAQNAGQEVDYVVPDDTLLIESPAAVTVDSDPIAQTYLDWLWTDEAQELWAKAGYRPVNKSLIDESQFPTPSNLFTVEDTFGGWAATMEKYFAEETGLIMQIEEELGVATS